MSKIDPLERSVSVGAELTKTGLKLNAKSRALAAIDRLIGNAAEFLNIAMERRHIPDRAKIEGERRLIEAITEHAIERIKTEKQFADSAAENYVRSITQRQENKDGVVRYAIEDLRREPVADEGAEPSLDSVFLNKIERHAEDASTEELRERWGRVLAAEIRARTHNAQSAIAG